MNTELDLKGRNEQLKSIAPEIFSEKYKEILYIGAKLNEPIRKQFKWQMENLSRHGCVTILEIWEENCHGLIDHEWFGRLYHDVKCGDVKEKGVWFEEGLYDFHGITSYTFNQFSPNHRYSYNILFSKNIFTKRLL